MEKLTSTRKQFGKVVSVNAMKEERNLELGNFRFEYIGKLIIHTVPTIYVVAITLRRRCHWVVRAEYFVE